MTEVLNSGKMMIGEEHPQSAEFQDHIDEVERLWQELNDALKNRQERLLKSEVAQQVRTAEHIYEVFYFYTFTYFI